MTSTRTISGSVEQHETPRWGPLEELLGPELCRWFMWMYAVRLDDGTELQVYKHIATRRYLSLALDASAFEYVREGYRPLAGSEAIAEAFLGWEELWPISDDPEADGAALERAAARAEARERRAA
jgi:hypothetical protein